MKIVCEKENDTNVYYVPSVSEEDETHPVVYMTKDMRYECNCKKHAFPTSSVDYEKCSHIKLLEFYKRCLPKMILYK